MGKVKEKTLRKVEEYFARETNIRGSTEIPVVLEDVRRDTQLSLVTIYKAIDNLVESGSLVLIDHGTRRSPKIYKYKANNNYMGKSYSDGNLDTFINSLDELIRELKVKEKVIEVLRNKLEFYQANEDKVLYRLTLSDDTEIIVRKRNK